MEISTLSLHGTILQKRFFERPTHIVAAELLGKKIIQVTPQGHIIGIITETESYGGHNDPASHGFKGKNTRNSALFGPVGHLYVYKIYGLHHCINVVARDEIMPAGGVLIRSLSLISGIALAQQRRNARHLKTLSRGPGNVGALLALSLADNGIDLTNDQRLYITEGNAIEKTSIRATPRIGISKGKEFLWRFLVY